MNITRCMICYKFFLFLSRFWIEARPNHSVFFTALLSLFFLYILCLKKQKRLFSMTVIRRLIRGDNIFLIYDIRPGELMFWAHIFYFSKMLQLQRKRFYIEPFVYTNTGRVFVFKPEGFHSKRFNPLLFRELRSNWSNRQNAKSKSSRESLQPEISKHFINAVTLF